MNRRRNFIIVFFSLAFFAAGLKVNSQTNANVQIKDSNAAAEQLRALYLARDYESGYERGREYAARFPENVRLRAWFILNEARNEMSAEAVKDAESLVETNRENAWAWFALAHALIRDSQSAEAGAAAEKAVSLAPTSDEEEFIFLRLSAFMIERKYDEIYRLLDENSAKIKDRARFLTSKAEAQYRHSLGEKPNRELRKQSFRNFAEAVKLNPNGVAANYIYGVYLTEEKRYADALPLLEKAVSLSPNSSYIRRLHWLAMLNGQPQKTEKQRTAEVVAEMSGLLRLRPDSVNALDTVAAFYGRELKMPEKTKEIEALIVEKFPASGKTEWILVNNYRAFEDAEVYTNKAKREKYKQMLRAFINRPTHVHKNLLGDTYLALFFVVETDAATPNDEMLKIIDGTVAHQTSNANIIYPRGAQVLADRKMFREAERIARLGFAAGRANVDKQRSFYKEEPEYAEALNWIDSLMRDALGWIFFKENRFEDAEREWLAGVKNYDKNWSLFNRLGQLYEAKNDLDRAEDFYTRGFAAFYGKMNPNSEALKNLYQKRNGNLTGFEAYFERLKAVERAARRERIVAARIKEPKSAAPFALKNLDAKIVSLADLTGKIVVVNIWGTWCAPCVGEMPEFQELHRKYLNDKDVAILTVNNDADLNVVKKFMRDKRYDFTVLRDENYLQTIGITTFPTTWFIDEQGKISFVKIGASDKLVEEFGWRIEELKKQMKSSAKN